MCLQTWSHSQFVELYTQYISYNFFGDAIWIHLTIYRQWSLRLMMLYHMIAGVGKMGVPNGPTNKSQTFSSAHLHSCNQCAADIILLSWEGHHQQWFKLMAWAHCFCCDSDLMKENMYFGDNFPWQYSPAIRKVAKRWTTFAMVYSMNPWKYDLEVASQDNSFEHQNLMGLQWEGPYVFGHRRMKACNMKYVDVYDIWYYIEIHPEMLESLCVRRVIEYLGLSVLGFMFDSAQHICLNIPMSQ